MTKIEADSQKPKRRKAARPGEILQAGLEEFAISGLAATRLEDIAQRAGIAKGTIYRYFDSKEDLFMAVVRSRLVLSLDQFEEMVTNYPGPTDALLRLVLTGIYRQFVGSDISGVIRILISEGPRFPGLVDLYHKEVISKGVTLLTHIITRGIERGEIRDGPAAREPRLIMAPTILAVLWDLTFKAQDPIDIEEYLNAHIDIILHGLSA
ncbi:TetR/AcrR family transcriptional regulator [Pararhizobium sp. IMCC21322]|uniref:TetR/AcrR family transcriptional regulator n=1 Tax=Pararhizobium sp. IMCC21322 TaxID=3067903 RepID=UPI0027428F7E|nr:TetR/AcrR family transcriptional regulator [Pararhizobium sp. IMCC21322]